MHNLQNVKSIIRVTPNRVGAWVYPMNSGISDSANTLQLGTERLSFLLRYTMVTEDTFIVETKVFSKLLTELGQLCFLGARPVTVNKKLWRVSFAELIKKVF